jgi:hypothetical protein
MLYVSEAPITWLSVEASEVSSLPEAISVNSCLLFLLAALPRITFALLTSLIFYRPVTMPAKDDPVATTILPAELSNGMSKDAIIEDLRRRLEESELSSNAGSFSSGGRRRRRSRKPKNGPVPSLATPPAPVLPRFSTSTATSSKKPKTKEAKPVKLVVGLNLNLELELKARIEGDLSLSLV